MALPFNAIDAWINPNLGTPADPKLQVQYLFPGLQERWERGTTLAQLLDEMDQAGVEKAVLCAGYNERDDVRWTCQAIEDHPERFVGSLVVDPRQGMSSVRLVESFHRDHGFKMIRLLAFETLLPYNDAAYYPIYAKCCELGLAVGVNVGIPGPFVPGRHQDPINVDDVCCFFPELTIIMSHGGEPWDAMCVKLMIKWPNLYYMSSAFAPRHIPKTILDYVNSRGANKVLWASDYPLLGLQRCTQELEKLDLRDEDRRYLLARGNAERLFFTSPVGSA